jgi:hypothetical protein
MFLQNPLEAVEEVEDKMLSIRKEFCKQLFLFFELVGCLWLKGD